MSASPGGIGYSHTHVDNQSRLQLPSQSISGVYLQPLGTYRGGGPSDMASHHQNGKPFAYEPLPMGSAAGSYHAVSAEMETLMVAMSQGSQRRGKEADGSQPTKLKADGKRSREELNRREQERVQQLNDRIYQIREQLEDAGVKTKKTKQSVLDNAVFYIERLQGDLAIAQQKAEQAESVVGHGRKAASSESDSVYERCFQQSTTPRVVVDMAMKPLAINAAFVEHAGHDVKHLMKKSQMRKHLTKVKGRLETIVKTIREKAKPLAVATTAIGSLGDVRVMLTASPVCDDSDKPVKIEFSVVPLDATPDNGHASSGSANGLDTFLC